MYGIAIFYIRTKQGGSQTNLKLGLWLCCCLLIISVAANAQQPGETAPEKTVWAMNNRAEKFLQSLSELSPDPTNSDHDIAQTWPRNLSYVKTDFASGATTTMKRVRSGAVTGAHIFRTELSRATWNVKVFEDGIGLLVDPVSNAVIGFSDDVLSRSLSQVPCDKPETEISRNVATSESVSEVCAPSSAEQQSTAATE